MRFKRSLKFRIFISYAIFGIAMGIILFLFLLLSYNQLEDKLITEHLEDEMEFFIKLVENNPAVNSLKTKKLRGYRLKHFERVDEFPFLNDLEPGIHERQYLQREYVVNSVILDNYRYYIVYDITDFEKQEYRLTIIFSTSILLAVLGSFWWGYILAGRVLAPVKHLADKLKSIHAHDLHIRLSKEFTSDEVGSLANSFDKFIERIQTFVDREKHFVSDASHELRTPIAVIQSTTEVLLSTNQLENSDRDRLLRIHRAVKHVTLSISALLILAREPKSIDKQQGGISIADIVSDIVDNSRELINKSRVMIDLILLAEPDIAAPDAVMSLLINNIIQNAIRYTPAGKIQVVLSKTSLCVTDTGIGIPQTDIDKIFERGFRAENVSGNGSGLGLALVKRICDHFDWTIYVSGDQEKGTVVTWKFVD